MPSLTAGGRITAVVDVPDEGAQGVLCAMGDWTSGFALYVIDGRLSFTVNTGVEAATIVADEPLGAGRVSLSCALVVEGDKGVTVELSHDDRVVGTGAGPQRLPFTWQHGGTALCLGHDRGFPVCDDYSCPFPWTGTLHEVVFEVSAPMKPDPSEELRTALHSE